ncbi:MAG: spore germination protein [Peptococcaceae bacterium]|nr:spore germination protein [Peptococcaceae bacterium]
MKKQQGVLQQALALITYKKTKRPKTFTLAEMTKGQDQGVPMSSSGDSSNKQGLSNNQEEDKEQQQSENRKGNQYESQDESQNESHNKEQDKPSLGTPRRRRAKKPLSASQVRSNRTEGDKVRADIVSNLQLIKQLFGVPQNKDLIIREFEIGNKKRAFVAYLDGMADKQIINNYILRPLFNMERSDPQEEKRPGQLTGVSLGSVIETNDTKNLDSIEKVAAEILKGNTALYVDGLPYFITCETIGFDKRGVESPKTEGIVKGPQEAFSENLRTNISLLRRIIRNSSLITEFFEVGEKTSTTIAVIYLKDVVNPALVKEVSRRLTNIKTDFLVSAGMLEELIEDTPFTIIPTILSTERPDRAASHLVEGRVVIFVDGTPFSMIVPVTMNELMHSPEDASLKWQYTSGLRLIRFFAFLAGSMLPGIYIALTTFHREMIPTDLLIAIAKAKENVPFPTLVEILLMELGFELIREAGIRIPGIIGNTLGIIGALILGDAAVTANIVSPILIIIVAVTGLSNFAIPNYSLAFGVRLLRFYYILAGTLLGFYGIALALIGFVLMLVNLKSFGIPFFSIIAPKNKKSKDVIFRWPLWLQESRPDFLNPLDRQRQPEIAREWAQQDADEA